MLGNGSNDVLELAARAFLDAGRRGGLLAARLRGLSARRAGDRRARRSRCRRATTATTSTRWRARSTTKTRLVFIANPNNPTGTFVAAEQLEAFIASAARSTCSSCSTRRTTNTCRPSCAPTRVEWLARYPNLVITRTFSKAYGLAGLRVGYAFAHAEVADLMNRVRQPFNVNSVALAAAAAALDDTEFVRESYDAEPAPA